MSTVSTRPLAALVPLSQLQAMDEQGRLVELASHGLLTLPKQTNQAAFQGPVVPNRGKLASDTVLEDRR